ncbi:TMEM175 family protein [Kangiella sp. HZ709]|uniref:TMEM175 family protein n=1 Tax=Kangiella sp. HZ709 TaxID=2666328 RepID=UPI0012B02DF1|nr:TMEM175 family protein [Kangiella sp. HZ709]MRX26527.1 DUF1211 domain-containing protein [Kangiella sp. HZ709]
MVKQITSEISWEESELAKLPTEDGFRMRGLETTRLDTLIDAGFAFVLTFLAISQDTLPTSFTELKESLNSVPALFLSFLILMIFWLDHRRWSRRYGIETKTSIYLSTSLLFALLIYIFPLRMIFESMFDFLTDGALSFNFTIETDMDARHFFALYAAGFLLMSIIVAALYRVAIGRKDALRLSQKELHDTKGIYHRWLLGCLFAIISLTLSYTLPMQYISLAGFILLGLFIAQYIYTVVHRKMEPS